MNEISALLEQIYGREDGSRACERLAGLIQRHRRSAPGRRRPFSHRDAILITYADSLRDPAVSPAAVLGDFARQHLKEQFSAIHLLPFFPYSSDDGFSVKDYYAVNPAVGGWEDIRPLGADFDLMFDYVLNHVSARSDWFDSYLGDQPGFTDLAIEAAPDLDWSMVTRPRTHPLLTPFRKNDGRRVHLWTTFSEDQIDLNYGSIDVLIRMVEVLLFYASQGARIFRLDAVAYLWKERGTACIHLSRTHAVVRLLRLILDQVDASLWIVTETNVPHNENVSYFGDGFNEAQMVYNFTLPPLLLHTLASGDGTALSNWARTLDVPSRETTFFNFTASHDGIGIRPLEGILSKGEIDHLCRLAVDRGGQVSWKQNSDGSRSPYELNVTYVDAVGPDGKSGTALHASKFLTSQAIALALPGVPGVYIHSLLGSRNWQAGVRQTGRARTINREPLDRFSLVNELRQERSFRSSIFYPYCRMLALRRRQPAFDPCAKATVLDLDERQRVFGLKRESSDQTIFALSNISGQRLFLALSSLGLASEAGDLITGRRLATAPLQLEPYQTVWLTP